MFRAVELYTFLNYCEDSPLEKVVLDCGAGFPQGFEPLLLRFHERGYQTHGIELLPERVAVAELYGREHGIDLGIRQGDMRALPFADASMSFVFSYNTIFHMTRAEMAGAVHEIERVLRPGGWCFVNFLSVDDGWYGQGEVVGPGEFLQNEGDAKALHTYLADDDAEAFFVQTHVVDKTKRINEWTHDGESYRAAYLDYMVQKAG
ncbi:MAG: class I SAM-dependent methyltransferase [Anaerolineae bacterium]|nr:class I SAM-dependent methyltransferase [Anaerolineae bacterium]